MYSADIRQSRPDSSLGVQVNVFKRCMLPPLRSGAARQLPIDAPHSAGAEEDHRRRSPHPPRTLLVLTAPYCRPVEIRAPGHQLARSRKVRSVPERPVLLKGHMYLAGAAEDYRRRTPHPPRTLDSYVCHESKSSLQVAAGAAMLCSDEALGQLGRDEPASG